MSKKYLVTQDQTVDGMVLDGDPVHYAVCSTAAAAAAKTAALSGFKLVTGAWAAIKFTVTNTAANPTLNINGTGAKAVRYRSTAVSAGALAANRIYLMVYDGTYWQIIGDLDTVYTHPTSAGNKHIPSGGAANQILSYSAAGTAKWSSSCNAAAINVITGTCSASSKTVPYQAGRTKALIEAYPNSCTEGKFAYLSVLLTGLSSNMTAREPVSVGAFANSNGLVYDVDSNGNISIAGFYGNYCVTWFN